MTLYEQIKTNLIYAGLSEEMAGNQARMIIDIIFDTPCEIIKPSSFLWFKFTDIQEDHNWGYINKERRRCLRCGKQEILFGEDDHGGEDWRQVFTN